MRYWSRTLIGAGLFIGSLVLFNVKLTELLDTGTCASGNQPYEIARPCPEGTGTDMLLLIGLDLRRPDRWRDPAPPWRGPERPATPVLDRPAALGAGLHRHRCGLLVHSLTSDVIGPDGELGGIIVGATFLFLGLPVLFYVGAGALGDRPTRTTSFSMPSASAARSIAGSFTARTGTDRITELERLERLRQSGALSQAEFEREKARILNG